jgi:hypothetical protein
VERPRRRLLAPARDAGLSSPGSIADGAIGHHSADKSATRPPETTRGAWPVLVTRMPSMRSYTPSRSPAGLLRGDTSVRLTGTYRSIRCAQLRPMRPVSGRLPGTPYESEEPAEPGRCTMPTPPPRHLARPGRPWRLLLFVFGLTTAVLAALVASATLLPQPEPPQRVPGVALPTLTTKPTPTSTSTTITANREPTTAPPPSTTPDPGRRAVSGPTTTTGPVTAQAPATVGGTTPTTAPSVLAATTQPTMTAPSTTAGPTTTAPTTTAASTTTLVTTTSIAPTTGPTTTTAPTTTGLATTTTGLATTTTGPVILNVSQPASVSAATVGALLPILALLYLLRGLVPHAGGTHARRHRANRPRRRG